MRTSGAEERNPLRSGWSESLRSLRSTIPRDRRCVMLTRVTPTYSLIVYLIGRTEMPTSHTAHLFRAQGRAAGSFARIGVRQTRLWCFAKSSVMLWLRRDSAGSGAPLDRKQRSPRDAPNSRVRSLELLHLWSLVCRRYKSGRFRRERLRCMLGDGSFQRASPERCPCPLNLALVLVASCGHLCAGR